MFLESEKEYKAALNIVEKSSFYLNLGVLYNGLVNIVHCTVYYRLVVIVHCTVYNRLVVIVHCTAYNRLVVME